MSGSIGKSLKNYCKIKRKKPKVTKGLLLFSSKNAIGLSNKKSEELAVSLLELGYRLIMIIPYGILNFKKQAIFTKFTDKMLVLSYVKPKHKF